MLWHALLLLGVSKTDLDFYRLQKIVRIIRLVFSPSYNMSTDREKGTGNKRASRVTRVSRKQKHGNKRKHHGTWFV
jgi:hypothetical protein